MLKKIFSKLLSLSLKQKIISGLLAAVIVASGVTAGIVVNKRQADRAKTVTAKTETTKKEDKEPEKTEETEQVQVPTVQVNVPSFTEVKLSTSSIQKDLNIYFNNTSGKKISGVDFKVKLIDPAKYNSISKYTDAINQDNAKIAAANSLNIAAQPYSDALQKQVDDAVKDTAQDDSATKDLTDGNHVNAQTGTPVTLADALQIEKNNDIAAYNKALSSVKGNTYEDKDKDGVIYLDSIDAGNYKACFVPVDGYSAQNFSSDANVKDKIEYKPVAEVKEKVQQNVPDPQPKVEVPVEAEIKDTVSHVESKKDEKISYNYTTSSQTLKSSVNGTNVALYASSDKTASEAAVSNNGESVLSATSENQGAVTAEIDSTNNTVLLKAVPSLKDTVTASVTVVYQKPSDGSSTDANNENAEPASECITYTVTVHGNSEELLANDNKTEIYTDNTGSKKATVGDYESGKSYNIKTDESKYYGWQTINGIRYYYDLNGNKVTGEQVIDGVKYSFGSDGALLTNGTGIDVSKWQGNINWSQVKTAVSYAIIRCGYRGTKTGALAVDPYYAKNMKNAKANGVNVGIYFYSDARNEAQAVEEASLAVQLAQEQGGVSLPIYIDIEGNMKSNSSEMNTAIANAFVKTVNAAGYRGGVYASYSFFNHNMNLGGIDSNASIWCARYNTYCGLKRKFDIWQYTSKGSVPGINGNVDMNISYF